MEAMDLTAPKQTAISTLRDAQLSISLVSILTKLAQARQAPVNSATLELYAQKLTQFPFESVNVAIGKIALEPRREGETAFPELATVLARVEVEELAARCRAAAMKRDREEKEYFERYLQERMEETGDSREVILARIRPHEAVTKP